MAENKATSIGPGEAGSPKAADSPPLLTFNNETAPRDPKNEDEWDASKVPPSRFQKRKGSIYSTPGSRDGHVDSNYAAKFHAKHAELGYNANKTK